MKMSMFYVSILGPYDFTYVGPFVTKYDADRFCSKVPKNFDAWSVSQSELDANFAEFGKCEIETPAQYSSDSEFAFSENR
jgi:hypothetical protein